MLLTTEALLEDRAERYTRMSSGDRAVIPRQIEDATNFFEPLVNRWKDSPPMPAQSIFTRRSIIRAVSSGGRCKHSEHLMPPFAPREYFDKHYTLDSKLFGSDVVNGATLGRSLKPRTRVHFDGLAEFVVCRFELCLLNQAIHAHFGSAHKAWLDFSAPNAVPRAAHRNEFGTRRPDNILRYAQDPPAVARVKAVRLTWDLLKDYTTFFFEEYLSRFLAEHQEISILRGKFFEAIARDKDCVVSLRKGRGWVSTHVKALLLDYGSGQKTERNWISATLHEREGIEASVRNAHWMFEFEASGLKTMIDHGREDSDQAKKKLALRLARYRLPLDLSQSYWQEAISIAARNNDHAFFRSLGRLLTDTKSGKDQNPLSEMRLQSFILTHWARRADGLPELFYLRFPDLLKVCVHYAGVDQTMDEKWLEKVCKRELGLKSFARRTNMEARLRLDEKAKGRREFPFRRPDGWLYP